MGQLNFGIDEEYNWTDLDACYQWYGKIGRWMLIAYDQMFLHWAHYPFISGFLALFMFSVAYAAWLGTHKDASFTAKLLFWFACHLLSHLWAHAHVFIPDSICRGLCRLW